MIKCGMTGVWPESVFKIFARANSSISGQSRFAGFSLLMAYKLTRASYYVMCDEVPFDIDRA
jgi:hypothetical protein